MIEWVVAHRLRIIATLLVLIMAAALFTTTFTIYDERKEDLALTRQEADVAKLEADVAKTRADLAAKQTVELCKVANENRQILRQVIELATVP